MLELIFSAIGLGVMLSLVFIGPMFFLLIETSFTRGYRHGIALDLGVISADILYIIIAYFASEDIIHLIDQYPGFYKITALLIFVYAIYMLLTKTKMHVENEEKLIQQNYIKTFINGLLMNFLNIGVLLFWLVNVIVARNKFQETPKVILYLGLVIATFLTIDLIKIYLANIFHKKLTEKVATTIRRIVGVVLVIFSIFIFLQSYSKFNQFDKQINEAEAANPTR